MSESPGVLDVAEFERLVRDALANLFDQAALATHALAARLSCPPGCSRTEELRQILVNAVERLKPSDAASPSASPEWRPYLLLRGRYVDGLSLQNLQESLSLSERQLRREHSRAVQAVSAQLWDLFFPGQPKGSPGDETGPGSDFPVTPSSLEVAALLKGVAQTLERRAESEGAVLRVLPAPNEPRALADRIILRQVLLSLLGYALDVRSDGPITMATETVGGRVVVRVRFNWDQTGPAPTAGEGDRALDQARFWCAELGAGLRQGVDPSRPGEGELILSLPAAGTGEPLLLVVDDQEVAFRLFQRYLGHTGLRLVGLSDGSEVVATARRLQPQAITLDVMMPNMDGWEVLQSLQADPATRAVPVIVCSVWEEPELASSLGAADFLKKPITQRDLLSALVRLRLLESAAGLPAAAP